MAINIFLAILDSGLRLGTPVALAALGELINERSGVVNIGIEGIMIIGAFLSVVTTYYTDNPLVGLLVGLSIGALLGFIHGVISVHLYGDQIVTGIGLILFGYGITCAGNAAIWGQPGFSASVKKLQPLMITSIDTASLTISSITLLTILIAIVLHVILKYTWIGLRLKSVGESPEVADSLGVNVHMIRLLACVVGGSLSGLAGAYLGVDWSGRFISYMSAGRGFIALAAIIVGGWMPLRTLLGGFLFGIFDSMQMLLFQLYGKILPPQFFQMIPYLATIVVFTIFFKKAKPPSSIGKPYKRE